MVTREPLAFVHHVLPVSVWHAKFCPDNLIVPVMVAIWFDHLWLGLQKALGLICFGSRSLKEDKTNQSYKNISTTSTE